MRIPLKNGVRLIALCGAFGVLWSSAASAADVHAYLVAGRFLQNINGENIPMWGYMPYDPAAQPTACSQVNNNPALQVPGPEIVASAGDNVIIHLLSCVRNVDNQVADGRTSVMIPGQGMPTVDNPNPGGGLGQTGPVFYPAGDPNFAGRMRSQVPDAQRLNANRPNPVTYTFNNVRAGTFVYHSGTHMQVQVQMGLHGPLTVCPAGYNAALGQCGPPTPYPGARTGFYRSYSLFYSEIDPGIHRSVDQSCYGPDEDATNCADPSLRVTSTIGYAPQYLLINGQPYDGSKLDLQTEIPLTQNPRRVLLRVRSAGTHYHSVTCKFCSRAAAIAEDGYLYTFRPPGGGETVFERLQESFLVAPLQTRDLYLISVDPDAGGPLGWQLMLDLDRFGEIPPVLAATP